MKPTPIPSLLLLAALATAAGSTCAQPAFPGAQGFGARATGGRLGTVVKVTNLNATGAGSLQGAVNTPGARIVVFAVSGVIVGDVEIPHGNLTIAGQTAPGAGITINGHLYTPFPTTFGNIIIRHVRVRAPDPNAEWPPAQHDSVQLSANRLLMLDHVDISHAVDENLDLYDGARDITIQWSNISFPVQGGGHPDGPNHNFGMLNGPNGGRISVHHNLFVHNLRRTPALSYGPAEVVNNVAYNVREGFVHNNPADGQFNLIGNTYKDGPSATLIPFFFDPENDPPTAVYYSFGNAVDDPSGYTGIVNNPFINTAFANEYGFYCCGIEASMFSATVPYDFSANMGYVPITTQAADVARGCVLALAGAWPRDLIANRSVTEATNRTGSYGNHRPANYLTSGLTPGTAPPDTDNDGMPNAWETANGLNPNSAADTHTVLSSGYPAIETYLNELARMLLPGAVDPNVLFSNGFEEASATVGACA